MYRIILTRQHLLKDVISKNKNSIALTGIDVFNQFLVKATFWNLVALYCFWFVSFPSYILNWGTLVCCKENCWFCLEWIAHFLNLLGYLLQKQENYMQFKIFENRRTPMMKKNSKNLQECIVEVCNISQTILLVPANI